MRTQDLHPDHHLAESLSRVFIQTRGKRVVNNLKQMRKEAPSKGAADCFDTAIEAVEEGLRALRERKA